MKKLILKKIECFVKANLDNLNWMHTKGIIPIAKKLAKLEKANEEVVVVAAYFHDFTKSNNLKRELYHHYESAEIARKFLKKLKLNKEFINQVYHCILSHSTPLRYFRTKAKKAHKASNFLPWPKTKEAKILFDADMIQQLSPFGIAKGLFINYVTYKKDFKKGFLDIKKTLMEDAYKNIFTKRGKKLAKEGIRYLKDFFYRLENE